MGQFQCKLLYTLRKKPLDCEISSDGEVRVDLTVGKNVHSVQRISGGTLNLTYEKGSMELPRSRGRVASTLQPLLPS